MGGGTESTFPNPEVKIMATATRKPKTARRPKDMAAPAPSRPAEPPPEPVAETPSATVAETPPASELTPAPAPPPAAEAESQEAYAGDSIALLIWGGAFVLLVLYNLIDLGMALFR
jgi:hypothetical protein